MSTKQNTSALTFIFITIFLDCVGIGIIVPVVPALIQSLGHVDNSQSASISGWLQFAYAITQFVCAPILGSLSDKYGRRPVLLMALLGFGLDYLVLAFAPNLYWLFAARIVSGMFGASITPATAYIADVSTPENKVHNFGLIGAAFGLGFILGPSLGGLVSQWGTKAPFIAASILSLLNFLYGYFILPESLSKENRRDFEWKRANPFSAIKRISQHSNLAGMLTSYTLLYLAGSTMQSVWQYFTIEKFDWNEKQIGFSLSFVGLIIGLVQGLLIRKIVPFLGQKRAIYWGVTCYAIGFMLFAFAFKGWMMYGIMIVYGLGGITGPSLQSLISNQTPNNAQGELQGALTSLVSITSIVGPLMMTHIFTFFTENKSASYYFPGAPFMTSAIITILSLVLALYSFQKLEFLKRK